MSSCDRMVVRTVGKGQSLSTIDTVTTPLRYNSVSESTQQTREERLAARSRAAIEMRRRVVVDQKIDLMRRGLRRRSKRWSSEKWTASLPVIWEEDGEDDEQQVDDEDVVVVKRNGGGRRSGGSKHVRSDSNDSVDGAFDLDVLLGEARL